jgi:hypothetical protein
MPNPLPMKQAAQAELMVNNLQQTQYQYLPEDIDFVEDAAGTVVTDVFDCDCNSFVGFVLGGPVGSSGQGMAPAHYAIIAALKEPDQARPRAFVYHDFFSSLTSESPGGWHRINFLQDARRGDIVAWRFPTIEENQDTGHVMFLAETPTMNASGMFTVRVYDSAAWPHFDDTRASGPFPSGVGSGIINFVVDDAGRPVAFQFGPPPHDETTYMQIAIGRAEPL